MIVLAVLLLASFVMAFTLHRSWDFAAVRFLNTYAGVYPALDHVIAALTSINLTAGVAFLAVIWWLWFACPETERPRLLLGVIASAVAALASRALQIAMPSHLRPLHEAALQLTLPLYVDPDALNHFNSFPSDHASLLFGLATTIWLVSRPLGAAAFLWAAVLNVSRIYEMYHFPSDVVGGAALGALAVYLAQLPAAMKAGTWLARWEQRSPPWFYMLAFLASYLSATLFEEVRTVGGGAFKLLAAWLLKS